MRLLLLLLCWSSGTLLCLGAEPIPLVFDPARAHDLEVAEPEPGTYDFVCTGEDPFIYFKPLAPPAGGGGEMLLAFDYFCPKGVDSLQIFYGPPIGPTAEPGPLQKAATWQPVSIALGELTSGKWTPALPQLRLDFGTRAGVHLQLRNVRLRPPTPAESAAREARMQTAARKEAAAKSLLEYIHAPAEPRGLTAVSAGRESITLSGDAPAIAGEEYAVAEVRPHESPWSASEWHPAASVGPGAFEVFLPRMAPSGDRLFSRWCLLRRKAAGPWERISPALYATELAGALVQQSPVPPTPRTKKGMAGVVSLPIAPELLELGIEHVTVNVAIDAFLRLAPGPGRTPFLFEGREFYADEKTMEPLDATMRVDSGQGAIISAIILIGLPQDEGLRAALAHPEAQRPGIFAMPNFTTAEGSRAYRAALNFLAQRYSRPENGLITNWILHNEIDQGWTWTNMGDQPMSIYLEHYMRSMRACYLAAQQYNEHARVFISLTHNWTTPEGAEGKNYCVREMLDLFAQLARQEGDFPWGVAYHPYPQDLLQPAAWLDKGATFSFSTAVITPKNIEVLDAYMKRPEMLYEESVRPVMLSEQGFHTKDDAEETQRIQAAAFVYTWHKIRPLSSILCFHNHRWIDSAHEGGLHLGVRTLATPTAPFGERKLSWNVLRALDTPDEAAATEFAKPILGVKDFSEIPYRGEIH